MSEPYYSICRYLTIAIYICIAAVLAYAYRRTSNRGFLLLIVSMVLWPILESLVEGYRLYAVQQLVDGKTPWLYPFSRMSLGGLDGGISPGVLTARLAILDWLIQPFLLLLSLLVLVK